MEIGGPAEPIKQTLSQVPGVLKVNSMASDKNLHLIVESKSDSELRPLIAKTIIEKGWQLFEMKPEGLSLEDVFLQLTTKEEGANQ
jgi:ABC-2 type transport system ATP-binding protein